MRKKEKIVAVITARGGSKGVPQKNIKPVLGKPLIAYSIEASLQSRTLSKTIVSTDDETIAKTAQHYGAEVPFLRPKHLATDTATSVSVLQHAINFLAEEKGYLADIVVCLQPTSPLRSTEDIDGAVTLCVDTGSDSVVSLCEADYHPYWMKKLEGDRVCPLMDVNDEKYSRRQDLPPVYQLNGALYVTRRKILMEEARLLGENTLAYIMPQERSIDIDSPLDFKLTELLMREWVSL